MGRIISEEPTIHKFEEWLRTAKGGSRYEYHRGNLAADREGIIEIGPSAKKMVAHVFYEPYHSLGLRVWRAYEKGHIELTQQREDFGEFRYFAIKRRNKR